MFRFLALGLLLVTSPSFALDLSWQSDPEAALAEALRQETFVLVDLYAEWCSWCTVLEEEVFTTPEFEQVTRGMVLLRVDVEDRSVGSALQAEYGIRSLPTTLILDGRGALAGEVAGYAPTDEYLRRIREQLSKWGQIQRLVETARGWTDLEQLRLLGDQLYERKDGPGAAVIYERLLEVGGEGPAAAWIRYRAADSHRRSGAWDSALKHLARARSSTAASSAQLGEQLTLLQFAIARDSGQCDEAKRSLEQFLRDHPESARAEQAAQTLLVLENGDGQICA